jgi:hypothetical protein
MIADFFVFFLDLLYSSESMEIPMYNQSGVAQTFQMIQSAHQMIEELLFLQQQDRIHVRHSFLLTRVIKGTRFSIAKAFHQ